MKGIRAFLGAGLMVVLLAGCASKASFEHDDMERIGVVSIMGDSAVVYYQGWTAFGNKQLPVDVSEARLDESYQARIEQAVRESFEYEVVHVEYDRDAWIRVEDPDPGISFKKAFFGEKPYEKYKTMLVELAQEYRLDAILILAPEQAYSGSTVKPQGLGVYSGGVNGRIKHAIAGIFAELVLINGVDGSVVEAARLKAPLDAPAEYFDTYAFQGRPVRDLAKTSLSDIAVRTYEVRAEEALGDLLKELMKDPYLSGTVNDALTSDWH